MWDLCCTKWYSDVFFSEYANSYGARGSSVGIATVCNLDDRGSILGVGKSFSVFQSVHTGSGAHSASYPVGTSYSFLGDKAAGVWRWPSQSSVDVKNDDIPAVSHAVCLHAVNLNWLSIGKIYLSIFYLSVLNPPTVSRSLAIPSQDPLYSDTSPVKKKLGKEFLDSQEMCYLRVVYVIPYENYTHDMSAVSDFWRLHLWLFGCAKPHSNCQGLALPLHFFLS
jgi:hypothetical protein